MNKFEEILKDGLVAVTGFPDEQKQLQLAKVTYQRLENEIIRVAALMTADENGDFPPTTKEELLKL